jgi:hypothetical protein
MVETHVHPDGLPAESSPSTEPQLFEGDPQRVGSSPKRMAIWPVGLTLLVVGGAALFYLWLRGAAPPGVAPSAESAGVPSPPPAQATPGARYPIESTSAQAGQAPLPSLQESDTVVLDGIAGAVGSDVVDKLLRREDVIRRIVATVDNLPRNSVAPRLLPVNPVSGRFTTAGSGEGVTIGADNAARYAPYVRVAEAVDAKTLAALYIRFYPLFQQAYRDLGYPDGNFNDRLVEAIDDLLAAPVVQGPIKLTQPKILYKYADPDLERRSAGQKVMMRMSGDNAARVKAKLTQFRREIVGPHAKPQQ